ncbi:dual oxidase maturation factor 1 isoform X2 [Atheta coriaria]
MKGWFDAFRYDGGPTLYSFNNRTAVTGDVTIITFLIIFCTLYVAFLIIYPGIRKERFTTFFTVTLSLFTGATILVSLFGSGWHVGHASIVSSYKAFSKEKVVADIGVYVGLNHVNITLQATPALNASSSDIDFNERFYWLTSDQMGDSFKDALFKGLPYPILTVAEYFSLGQEGLSWGGQYRAAGYYAIIMLWTCFALWLLMNLMLIVVPRYGAVLMTAVGIFLLSTVCGYLGMLPDNPLTIHLEGRTLYFHLGWCFWLVFTAGCICLVSGVIITTTEIIFPNSFSTILEVDYDTPYDRHIIIEDSHGRRFQKKRASSTKLEDPPGLSFGSRLLRRLSSKTPEKMVEKRGADNQAFEMEPRKSSWQYPFRQRHSLPEKKLSRTISHDSLSTRLSREVPSIHKEFNRLRNNSDKIHEVSMW